MARVILNQTAGHGGKYSNVGWNDVTATVHVVDLAPAGGTELLASAYSALYSANLGWGAAHPEIDGLYNIGEMTARVMSKTRVDFDVVFRRPDRSQPSYIGVRGGVATATEKTNYDADGNPISLAWKSDAAADAITQAGTVDVSTPVLTLEFAKTYSTCPAVAAMAVVGKTNSSTWQSCGAGYWLCTGFQFDSSDGGASWPSTIAFAYNEKKWKQEVFYLLESGKPPANLLAEYNTDAHKLIKVYGEAAFGDLGLPGVI